MTRNTLPLLAVIITLLLVAGGANAAWTNYGALEGPGDIYTQMFTHEFATTVTTDSVTLDLDKCNKTWRTMNASIDDASTDFEYDVFTCDTSTDTASDCYRMGGAYSQHAKTGFDPSKQYVIISPTTAASGDTARVTITCESENYVYNADTSAWEEMSDVDVSPVAVYFNDFLNTTDDLDTTNDWTVVDVGTVTDNPIIQHGVARGILRSGGDASSDNEGASVSLAEAAVNGQACTPTAGGTCEIQFRVALQDGDDTDWFVGLCEDDTAAMMAATGDMKASEEYVVVHYNVDDDTAYTPTTVYAGADNTETAATASGTMAVTADDTYDRFTIKLVGDDEVFFYQNGAEVGLATVVSDFTAPLYPCFGHVSNDSDADLNYIYIDYIRMEQTRF